MPWFPLPWESSLKSGCFSILRSLIHMTMKLCFEDHGPYVCSHCSVRYLQVCGSVLPSDFQDWSEAAHMEAFQQLQVFPVKCACLTSIQEDSDNNLVHFGFDWLLNVMLIQYSCTWASKGLIAFTNFGTDIFVNWAIAGDNTSKALKLFHCNQCYTFNRNWK